MSLESRPLVENLAQKAPVTRNFPTRNEMLAKSPKGYDAVFDSSGKLNVIARKMLMDKKRPERTDVGPVAPATGETKRVLLDNVSTLVYQEGPVTETQLAGFTAAMIDLIGGLKIAPGEQLAELPFEHPIDGVSSVVLHRRDTSEKSSFNISSKDSKGKVIKRLVAGINFAESNVGDYPTVTKPYPSLLAGNAGADSQERYPALHVENGKPHEAVTLFVNGTEKPGFALSEDSREVMKSIYKEVGDATSPHH